MKRYLDLPLALFIIIMVAAASITSHGTFVFYSYFLDYELAIAATVVLTAGIPLLEWAAVLHEKYRLRYICGMVWLLLMEAVAQYWQGQAVFAKRVAAQFPDATGIDIATWAAQPSGRLLPIVYLASLSAIVVYFGYAASRRVADLRSVQSVASSVHVVAAELQEVDTNATDDATDVHDLATTIAFLRDERKLTWDEIKEFTGKSRTWCTRLYNERKEVAA